VQEIAAGGASDAELDRSVVVSFLLNYGVVVYHITKTVVGDSRVVNGEQGARNYESADFFGLSDEPEVTVEAGFCRGVGQRISVKVQVQNGG
jgi:hypothetical protein